MNTGADAAQPGGPECDQLHCRDQRARDGAAGGDSLGLRGPGAGLGLGRPHDWGARVGPGGGDPHQLI